MPAICRRPQSSRERAYYVGPVEDSLNHSVGADHRQRIRAGGRKDLCGLLESDAAVYEYRVRLDKGVYGEVHGGLDIIGRGQKARNRLFADRPDHRASVHHNQPGAVGAFYKPGRPAYGIGRRHHGVDLDELSYSSIVHACQIAIYVILCQSLSKQPVRADLQSGPSNI